MNYNCIYKFIVFKKGFLFLKDKITAHSFCSKDNYTICKKYLELTYPREERYYIDICTIEMFDPRNHERELKAILDENTTISKEISSILDSMEKK